MNELSEWRDLAYENNKNLQNENNKIYKEKIKQFHIKDLSMVKCLKRKIEDYCIIHDLSSPQGS